MAGAGIAGMRGILAWAMTAGMTLAVLAGCDMRTAPLSDGWHGRVETLAVSSGDPEELATVELMQKDRVAYIHALNVLKAYYESKGVYEKKVWTEAELKNVREAQTFRFEGAPAPAEPVPQAITDVSEASLVEQVVANRQAWQADLDKLADIYGRQGATLKAKGIQNIKDRFEPQDVYDYFGTAEIPPATLRPTEVVQSADELYEKALAIHLSGKPLPLITDYDKEKKALAMFLELVHKYPTSTKIAMSAYYIGDIYKEYFQHQELRAVQWYQRAWEWEPRVLKPARFQAAVLYDFRLKEHSKALPLYYDVLKYETFNKSNCDFAADRIEKIKRGENIK
jgi:TolA-binding protein